MIVAANAYHSILDYRRTLTENGICVIVGGGRMNILRAFLLGPLLSLFGTKKIRFFITKMITRDLVLLKDLMEAGKVVPIIDRRYPLSEAAEALRYRDEGHAQGKVVITVKDIDKTSTGQV